MSSITSKRLFHITCKCLRLQKRLSRNRLFAASVHQLQQHRCCTVESIPPPHVEGTEKEYAAKIRNIVEDIGKLTLIEVADLNELLKKTLNIKDAPMMAMGAMPAAASVEEEAEPVQEKTLFNVKLVSFAPDKKIQLIKEIKNLVSEMNLVQAKKFVEGVPQILRSDVTKEEAETLKKTIADAGGEVEIA